MLKARIDLDSFEDEWRDAKRKKLKDTAKKKYKTVLWAKCEVETLERVLFMIRPSLAD